MSTQISIKMLADLLPQASDLSTNDSLPMTLTLEECNLFIQLASQLKREILHLQRPDWPEDNPPPGTLLPNSVVRFLACCLGWREAQIRTGWNTFGGTVWKTAGSDDAGSGTVSELFKRHGHAEKLGSYYLTSTLLVLICLKLFQPIITFIPHTKSVQMFNARNTDMDYYDGRIIQEK